MERLPWTIRPGPKCNHKEPYEREAEGDVMLEAESKAMPAASPVWKRQGVDSPLEPPEETSPANTLIFSTLRLISDFWPPGL